MVLAKSNWAMFSDVRMNCLRTVVERWLAPTHGAPLRISRFGFAGSDRRRRVRVEVMRTQGSVVILFFKHDDGAWHVFPPQRERLSMGVSKTAAR